MSKNKNEETVEKVETVDAPDERPAKPKRIRKYIFPDIDGGGPSVTIEATSSEEATELFRKGQA